MKFLPFSLCALLLAGCASEYSAPNPPSASGSPAANLARDPSDGWIQGSLSCVESASVYSFRIQKKIAWGGSATGGVVAINPSARFSGQYTGIIPGGQANAWAQASGWNSSGGYNSASGSAYGSWRSNTANTQATLTDGKGTMIQLSMEIQAGWSPHGIGQGIDNKGRHYSVQF